MAAAEKAKPPWREGGGAVAAVAWGKPAIMGGTREGGRRAAGGQVRLRRAGAGEGFPHAGPAPRC